MKKLLVLLPFFLFIIFSCQNKETQAKLDEVNAKTELEKQNKALIEKYIEAWNTQDFKVIDECLSPQIKVYVPSNAEDPMSLELFKEWLHGILQPFPDSHYDIRDIFCEGDRICVRWAYTASHQGDYMGLPPSGMKVQGSAIEIFRVENGKIVEERSEMDAMGLVMQLGFELKLKE